MNQTPPPYDTRTAWFFKSYRQLPPPIIVLGMHRSGTSILTEMLQVMGVYIGRKLSQHSEPLFIAHINDELLEKTGSTWWSPESYLARCADPLFHDETVEHIEKRMVRGFPKQFLGLRQAWSLRAEVPEQWGFKDPRTSITLPQWLELFPEAKLIHIARHPLDVAISIQRREEQRQKEGYEPIPANLDLDHGLQLWEQYVAAARRVKDTALHYHEFRFEDLMAAPAERLKEVVRFCGFDPGDTRIAQAAAMADAQRTRRYEDERFAPWRAKLVDLPSAQAFGYK